MFIVLAFLWSASAWVLTVGLVLLCWPLAGAGLLGLLVFTFLGVLRYRRARPG